MLCPPSNVIHFFFDFALTFSVLSSEGFLCEGLVGAHDIGELPGERIVDERVGGGGDCTLPCSISLPSGC